MADGTDRRNPPTIGFFYNHDASHQVFHTATVVEALARRESAEIVIIVTSQAQLRVLESILDPSTWKRLRVELLCPHALFRPMLSWLDNLLPASRLCALIRARRRLAELDALVVTETTSTLLKSRLKMGRPLLIWVPHGTGDRAVGFGSEIRWFDHVLLSGSKVRDRMLNLGLIRQDGHEIVGYPKFDAVSR